MKNRARTFSAFFGALIPFALPNLASAVIVAGSSGGGNNSNNTTRAQLEAELAVQFPQYGNVVNFSDSTGVYLGYNPNSSDVWVLSAKHVSNSSQSITIQSNSYNFQERIDLSDDLELNRYSRPDGMVPTLPSVSLSSSTPTGGAQVIMIGIGQNREEDGATLAIQSDATDTGAGTTGYHWDGTRIKRWGTNNIEAEFPDALETGTPRSGVLGRSGARSGTTAFYTDFDNPGPAGWTTTNEATGSLFDSGGGVFIENGDSYELAGVFTAITRFDDEDPSTPDQDPRSSAFGSGSVITDISSSRDQIIANTGTLVPEPSSALLLPGLLLVFTRRKR